MENQETNEVKMMDVIKIISDDNLSQKEKDMYIFIINTIHNIEDKISDMRSKIEELNNALIHEVKNK